MSETATIYTEVYVSLSKKGRTSYYRYSTRQIRLFPITRADAEASFAAGATVYRKAPGKSIWEEGGVQVIGEQAAA